MLQSENSALILNLFYQTFIVSIDWVSFSQTLNLGWHIPVYGELSFSKYRKYLEKQVEEKPVQEKPKMIQETKTVSYQRTWQECGFFCLGRNVTPLYKYIPTYLYVCHCVNMYPCAYIYIHMEKV